MTTQVNNNLVDWMNLLADNQEEQVQETREPRRVIVSQVEQPAQQPASPLILVTCKSCNKQWKVTVAKLAGRDPKEYTCSACEFKEKVNVPDNATTEKQATLDKCMNTERAMDWEALKRADVDKFTPGQIIKALQYCENNKNLYESMPQAAMLDLLKSLLAKHVTVANKSDNTKYKYVQTVQNVLADFDYKPQGSESATDHVVTDYARKIIKVMYMEGVLHPDYVKRLAKHMK